MKPNVIVKDVIHEYDESGFQSPGPPSPFSYSSTSYQLAINDASRFDAPGSSSDASSNQNGQVCRTGRKSRTDDSEQGKSERHVESDCAGSLNGARISDWTNQGRRHSSLSSLVFAGSVDDDGGNHPKQQHQNDRVSDAVGGLFCLSGTNRDWSSGRQCTNSSYSLDTQHQKYDFPLTVQSSSDSRQQRLFVPAASNAVSRIPDFADLSQPFLNSPSSVGPLSVFDRVYRAVAQFVQFSSTPLTPTSLQPESPSHSTPHRFIFERYRRTGPLYSSSPTCRSLSHACQDNTRRLPIKRWRRAGKGTGEQGVKNEEQERGVITDNESASNRNRTLSPLSEEQQETSDGELTSARSGISYFDARRIPSNRGTAGLMSHVPSHEVRNQGIDAETNTPNQPLATRTQSIRRNRQGRATKTPPLFSAHLRSSGHLLFTKPESQHSGYDGEHERRSHWREVVGFHQVRHYTIRNLHSDLMNLDVPGEFMDAERTVLAIDGSHLLSCGLLTESHKASMVSRIKSLGGSKKQMSDFKEKYQKETRRERHKKESEDINIYVFENGVAVLWGLHQTEGNASQTFTRISNFLSFYSDSPLPSSRQSQLRMTFCLIDSLPSDFPIPPARVKHERLYMKTNDLDEQLAASLALAQSMRLTAYEEAVEETIQKFGCLPLRLASKEFHEYSRYGDIDEMNIQKGVAEVYTLVINVNVVEDFLDVPEYFWHREKFQPFWQRIHRYLDIHSRIQILNVRVGYIQEILKVISNERVEAQGFHLTWCVIILLCINVIAIVIRETLDHH